MHGNWQNTSTALDLVDKPSLPQLVRENWPFTMLGGITPQKGQFSRQLTTSIFRTFQPPQSLSLATKFLTVHKPSHRRRFQIHYPVQCDTDVICQVNNVYPNSNMFMRYWTRSRLPIQLVVTTPDILSIRQFNFRLGSRLVETAQFIKYFVLSNPPSLGSQQRIYFVLR